MAMFAFLKELYGKARPCSAAVVACLERRSAAAGACLEKRAQDAQKLVVESSTACFKEAEAAFDLYENFYNNQRRFRMAYTAFCALSYAVNVWETKHKDSKLRKYMAYTECQISMLKDKDVTLKGDVVGINHHIQHLYSNDKNMSDEFVQLKTVVDGKAEKLGLDKVATDLEKLKRAFSVKPTSSFVFPVVPGSADARNEMRFQQHLMARFYGA